LHCRSAHSLLNQAATRSSEMWRQEMLPSILHGCHFDTISSFSIKIVSRIFLIRLRTSRPTFSCFLYRPNLSLLLLLYFHTIFHRVSVHEYIWNSWSAIYYYY
jgi:hypothetical protein